MGQNHLRSLIALGFQASIIVCVAIYAVRWCRHCHRIRTYIIMAIWELRLYWSCCALRCFL